MTRNVTHALNKRTFQRTILNGIKKASAEYDEMSGWSIDLSPEYYLTCKVAEHLRAVFKDHQVAIEVSVAETRKAANAVRTGRKNKTSSGRFDIVMYHKDDNTPVAVVEAKNPVTSVTKTQLKSDICRIVSSVSANRQKNKKNQLLYGAFVFTSYHYGDKKNGKRPAHSLQSLLSRIEKYAKHLAKPKKGNKCNAKIYSSVPHLIKEKNEKPYVWCGTCMIFAPIKYKNSSTN